jgi:small conductance mechanosensitive channel
MRPSIRITTIWCHRTALLLGLCLIVFNSHALAQQESDVDAPQPTTVSNVTIPVDHLQVILRSLTKDELTVELDGWLDLLRAKIKEVGETELKIKALAAGESSDSLTKQLLELRTEETALSQRAQIVIDDLKAKGGDVETEQAFVDSVSNLSETTDAASFWAALSATVKAWYEADDGGKLLKKRFFLALIILVIFWLISKFAGRITAKALSRHLHASTLLENFARRTTGGVVLIVGVLTAVSVLGVQIGPLMAALGAGGFIVGFALQETLGSFASGLMIMVYRPFDVDDFVSIAGEKGTVKMMSLVSTTVQTVDNKLIVIPNKKAWSDTIVNYTGNDIRRVDLVFGIGYDDDIQRATELLERIAHEHSLVLDSPTVNVHVDELAASSVNLFCGPWVKTEDYWTVHWDLTRQVKEQFDKEGISFPFPQRDVHLQPAPIEN